MRLKAKKCNNLSLFFINCKKLRKFAFIYIIRAFMKIKEFHLFAGIKENYVFLLI